MSDDIMPFHIATMECRKGACELRLPSTVSSCLSECLVINARNSQASLRVQIVSPGRQMCKMIRPAHSNRRNRGMITVRSIKNVLYIMKFFHFVQYFHKQAVGCNIICIPQNTCTNSAPIKGTIICQSCHLFSDGIPCVMIALLIFPPSALFGDHARRPTQKKLHPN